MFFSRLTPALILGATVNGYLVPRQSGPVDPGTAPDCRFYDEALNVIHDCAYFEQKWGVSHANFVYWNPSVKNDCSGIKAGNSYCVDAEKEAPGTSSSSSSAPGSTTATAGTTTTSGATTPTQPTPTTNPTPSPTQDGMVNTCAKFYQAVSGDTCDKIVIKYGTFTLKNFVTWNPAVKGDCSGLWAGYYYCVGVPGTPTAPPSTTMPPTPTAPSGPSPTQGGIIATCRQWYKAESGDTCLKIVDKYRTFSLAQFQSWNPAVGSDCTGLWAGYYYCIGIPGTPTQPTSTSTSRPPTTTTPSGPSPTQPGIISTCNRFHQAVAGDSCYVIANKYGTFTVEQFIKWNPAVNSDCSALFLGYYYCIGIPGTPTSKPTSKPPTTPTGCPNPSLPTPTQPGAVCQCKKWHKVESGDYCDSIIRKYNINADQFHTWNPQVGRACTTLWLGYYVCVGA
ncbi:LysM domain-containing protein [Nannizzia gypsea CBS 118893]|uniref:LysM domain-containing protein n=1 Tax=Arthroderma gypseum (strain ATCC MYA-4604 / CBS 118893) TaxID=535722 RepID=E4UMN0_ARTGP|nr:LysM domain-containing protein [Nannizzia gypsea CBS 118893]EFQ99447.1 LysM domain-containing protein [Nannizzia gypsea CBS 118893]